MALHLHIIGIGGTFMAQLAHIAIELGYHVTGCDGRLYPPMSTVLEEAGIEVIEGFQADQLDIKPDLLIVGNIAKRGMPIVERMLDERLPYQSGPEWLKSTVLKDRHVIAVSGTHGKTTTTAMIVYMMKALGLNPGYLVAGLPRDFPPSSLGEGPYFVIEADEYDTAFFDKRAKFVHYEPQTLVITSLEFDHIDIYQDLAAIQTQFHHLLRLLPSHAKIIALSPCESIDQLISKGCWSVLERFGFTSDDWHVKNIMDNGRDFIAHYRAEMVGSIKWSLIGEHNVLNALAAIAVIEHLGLDTVSAMLCLSNFNGVARRCEVLLDSDDYTLYDDFAHHPTAVELTLKSLRADLKAGGRLLAAIEPRSHTMRRGVHAHSLPKSLSYADKAFCYMPPDVEWSFDQASGSATIATFKSVEALVDAITQEVRKGDNIVVMSNGGFEGLSRQLQSYLANAL